MRAPPAEEQRLVLLNDVWAEVRKLQDTPLEYLTVANSWFEFAMKFDSAEEVGFLFRFLLFFLSILLVFSLSNKILSVFY